MELQALLGKVVEYSSSVLVVKAKSWASKFAIGAGTEALVPRAEAFIRASGTMDGDNVDVAALRRIVMAGFNSAGHLDLMGGLLGFDPSDAEDLFKFIGEAGDEG